MMTKVTVTDAKAIGVPFIFKTPFRFHLNPCSILIGTGVPKRAILETFEFRVKMGIKCIMETRATSVMTRYRLEPEPIPCQMINCFCMFSDYQPMTLNEWIEIDRNRREGMNG